jgi:hypothetical protein
MEQLPLITRHDDDGEETKGDGDGDEETKNEQERWLCDVCSLRQKPDTDMCYHCKTPRGVSFVELFMQWTGRDISRQLKEAKRRNRACVEAERERRTLGSRILRIGKRGDDGSRNGNDAASHDEQHMDGNDNGLNQEYDILHGESQQYHYTSDSGPDRDHDQTATSPSDPHCKQPVDAARENAIELQQPQTIASPDGEQQPSNVAMQPEDEDEYRPVRRRLTLQFLESDSDDEVATPPHDLGDQQQPSRYSVPSPAVAGQQQVDAACDSAINDLDQHAKANDDAEEPWKCDVCYNYNKDMSALCLLCGTPMGRSFSSAYIAEMESQSQVSAADSPHNRQHVPVPKVWSCGVCSKKNENSSAFCAACGTDKPEPVSANCEQPFQVASPSRKEKTKNGTPHVKPRTTQKKKYSAATKRRSAKILSQPGPKLTRTTRTIRTTPTPSKPTFVPARWPCDVRSLRHHYNPNDVRFEFESPFFDCCDCEGPCRSHTCRNGRMYVFCSKVRCSFMGMCGNALTELDHLQLARRCGTAEFTVLAGESIDAGVVVGEYLGEIVVEDIKDREQSHTPESKSAFRLKLKRKAQSHPRKDIYIDAAAGGSITRFLNHSCTPVCEFREVRSGDRHTVVVTTIRAVRAGEEITVDYGDNLWFVCQCGEADCCHKHLQHASNK